MNNNLIILELFLSAGEYIVLNDFHCMVDFHKNELLNIRFYKASWPMSGTGNVSNFYLGVNKKNIIQSVLWENVGDKFIYKYYYVVDFINNVLPNIKKLSPEELIIKDIIT